MGLLSVINYSTAFFNGRLYVPLSFSLPLFLPVSPLPLLAVHQQIRWKLDKETVGWMTEMLGDSGRWTVDWKEILCCCVFSVKQLVISREGRISEEIRSKDHLPTCRSHAGFRPERGREREGRLKRSDGSGLWQKKLTPSLNGQEPSICSFLFSQSLPFPPFSFCCALHRRTTWHWQIGCAGFGIALNFILY